MEPPLSWVLPVGAVAGASCGTAAVVAVRCCVVGVAWSPSFGACVVVRTVAVCPAGCRGRMLGRRLCTAAGTVSCVGAVVEVRGTDVVDEEAAFLTRGRAVWVDVSAMASDDPRWQPCRRPGPRSTGPVPRPGSQRRDARDCSSPRTCITTLPVLAHRQPAAAKGNRQPCSSLGPRGVLTDRR